MRRFGFAGAVLVATMLLAPAPAAADGLFFGLSWGHERVSRGGPAFRYGYDRGWREGAEEGRHDARKRRDPRYWREREFRDADRGYKRWMGPRWDYAAGFRRGYEEGYRRAYAASRPGRYDRRYDRRRPYDDHRHRW